MRTLRTSALTAPQPSDCHSLQASAVTVHNVAPNIDEARVQRVANEMYQFQMLNQPFHVSSMLGGL